MANKLVRYISRIPGQEFFSSYNAGLGSQALVWAKDTARLHKGIVLAEYSDGKIEEVRSYIREYEE